jgi:transcription initiation factor IIE alpha subunit
MSGDHNQYQKDKSYLDFECPRCGHCCYVDDDDTSQERVDETVKQEHEPVAWANSFDLQNFDMKVRTCPDLHHTVPLYTALPKRTWVGLTDEEIAQGLKESWVTEQAWQSAVWWAEAKLKEKNT